MKNKTTKKTSNSKSERVFSPSRQLATSKQDMLMASLTKFFKSDKEKLGKMIPILTQQSKISLRIFDYCVTNYARRKNISYFIKEVKNGAERSRYFNVYLNYKSQLKAYSKHQFDPFCRKWRPIKGKKLYCGIKFYYEITKDDDKVKKKFIETTVAQLNFFRWALQNKVYDYLVENFNDIAHDMIMHTKPSQSKRSTKAKKSDKTDKQKESQTSASKTPSKKSSLQASDEAQTVPSKTRVTAHKTSHKESVKPISITATKQVNKRRVKVLVDFN